jgi:hypothetical protein
MIKTGIGTPAGPYAQMLSRVQQMCSATGLNQVCYANGQITLQPKTGTVTFTQPGAIADLANVQGLSLTSSSADSQKWSLAFLRLRANSVMPDQGLTILAFGNVQISDISLFENQVDPGDAVTLPSLQFTSSPIAGATGLGSSGLIVTNPTEEELLSLTLNGAAITLGSTTLVRAQPGSNEMTVAMATGTSLTEVNGESSAAARGQQVSVPLDQNGKASGPPQPAVPADPVDDLLTPLPTQEEIKKEREAYLTRLNRAIDRCLQGRSAYVYNVLYWVSIFKGFPPDPEGKYVDPAKLVQAYSRAAQCLTFEVDFDSNVTTSTTGLTESSHLQTQGLRLQFNYDGTLKSGGRQTLDYLSYTYNTLPGCPITTQTTPGTLEVAGGSLKIVVNQVRISMTLWVTKQPTDKAITNCPPAPPMTISHAHWVPVFSYMHDDLWEKPELLYRFNDWKYTAASSACSEPSLRQACSHFGEAIYNRTHTEAGFTFGTTTYLILVHTPQS